MGEVSDTDLNEQATAPSESRPRGSEPTLIQRSRATHHNSAAMPGVRVGDRFNVLVFEGPKKLIGAGTQDEYGSARAGTGT